MVRHFPSNGRFMASRAFTMTDLLVLLAIGALILPLTLGAIGKANEQDNRIQCAKQLKLIGQSMLLYANDNRGWFPRVKFDIKSMDKPHVFTAAEVADPFDAKGPVNDVTAAMFLLLRTQDLAAENFTCPSTEKKPLAFPAGKSAKNYSNFADGASLSYSMHNPYPSVDAVNLGAKWNFTLVGEFAVMADLNPGTADVLTKLNSGSPAAELKKGNSRNHGQDGQNVLFGDGHIEFVTNPFCGIERDNIYTFGPSGKDGGGKGVVGPSSGPQDSVLLPTAEEAAAKK